MLKAEREGEQTGAVVKKDIDRSKDPMPKGAKFVWPHKIHAVIGAPIRVPEGGTSKEQRDASRRTTLELHAELQRLLDRAELRAGGRRRSR